MTIHRLFLAVILLTIAACSSPVGLGGSPSCTLDPDDNDLECPVSAALQR